MRVKFFLINFTSMSFPTSLPVLSCRGQWTTEKCNLLHCLIPNKLLSSLISSTLYFPPVLQGAIMNPRMCKLTCSSSVKQAARCCPYLMVTKFPACTTQTVSMCQDPSSHPMSASPCDPRRISSIYNGWIDGFNRRVLSLFSYHQRAINNRLRDKRQPPALHK